MKAAGVSCWPNCGPEQAGRLLAQEPHHAQLLPLVLCAKLHAPEEAVFLRVEAFEFEHAWWFLLDEREALVGALEQSAELFLVSEGVVAQARARMVVHPWLIPELAAHCAALFGARFLLLGHEASLRVMRLELIRATQLARWDERFPKLEAVTYD